MKRPCNCDRCRGARDQIAPLAARALAAYNSPVGLLLRNTAEINPLYAPFVSQPTASQEHENQAMGRPASAGPFGAPKGAIPGGSVGHAEWRNPPDEPSTDQFEEPHAGKMCYIMCDRKTFARTLQDELNNGVLLPKAIERSLVPPLPKQPNRDAFCAGIDAAMRAGRPPRIAIGDALFRSRRRPSRRAVRDDDDPGPTTGGATEPREPTPSSSSGSGGNWSGISKIPASELSTYYGQSQTSHPDTDVVVPKPISERATAEFMARPIPTSTPSAYTVPERWGSEPRQYNYQIQQGPTGPRRT